MDRQFQYIPSRTFGAVGDTNASKTMLKLTFWHVLVKIRTSFLDSNQNQEEKQRPYKLDHNADLKIHTVKVSQV